MEGGCTPRYHSRPGDDRCTPPRRDRSSPRSQCIHGYSRRGVNATLAYAHCLRNVVRLRTNWPMAIPRVDSTIKNGIGVSPIRRPLVAGLLTRYEQAPSTRLISLTENDSGVASIRFAAWTSAGPAVGAGAGFYRAHDRLDALAHVRFQGVLLHPLCVHARYGPQQVGRLLPGCPHGSCFGSSRRSLAYERGVCQFESCWCIPPP